RLGLVGDPAEQLAQPLARVLDAFQAGEDLFQLGLLPALQRGLEQRIARGEVPVEAALGDAEATRQRLYRQAGDAALRDHVEPALGPVVGGQPAVAFEFACCVWHGGRVYPAPDSSGAPLGGRCQRSVENVSRNYHTLAY